MLNFLICSEIRIVLIFPKNTNLQGVSKICNLWFFWKFEFTDFLPKIWDISIFGTKMYSAVKIYKSKNFKSIDKQQKAKRKQEMAWSKKNNSNYFN